MRHWRSETSDGRLPGDGVQCLQYHPATASHRCLVLVVCMVQPLISAFEYKSLSGITPDGLIVITVQAGRTLVTDGQRGPDPSLTNIPPISVSVIKSFIR